MSVSALETKHHCAAIFIGVIEHSLACFSDYMSQRLLHVKSEQQSHPLRVTKGIPQGSELDLMLFTHTQTFVTALPVQGCGGSGAYTGNTSSNVLEFTMDGMPDHRRA